MPKPTDVTIRTYQVGFGDCFLMSIAYDQGPERHVLIDFGTTKIPDDAPKSRMEDIARDIEQRSGGKLTAIVATHRHQDHIKGFTRSVTGKGPGAIIARLDPDLVCQPWTEHPDLAEDATAAMPNAGPGMTALVRSLGAMQSVAANYVQEARTNHAYLARLDGKVHRRLKFIGEDNVRNRSAVLALKAMGHDKDRGEYLHAGQPTRLSAALDCDVLVLGPPTVEQHASVRKQRPEHAGEYWHLSARARGGDGAKPTKVGPAFPDHVAPKPAGAFPARARWLISRAKRLRGRQMLQIVTALDHAMNNTSLILLFRIGSKTLLFPGDAQWENWEFALADPAWKSLLADVDLYKVGHHGSLNATPRTLWRGFAKRGEDASDPARMTSLMSTLAGEHGTVDNKSEVPRTTLVRDLKRTTNLLSTQAFAPSAFFQDAHLDVR